MILVDKDIKKFVSQGKLIKEGYKEENVGAISYDITIDTILAHNENTLDETDVEKKDVYYLGPNEYVMVKSVELLSIPTNILGRIADKNSLLRFGISVTGPHYQPGHTTYAYLRVQNISCDKIKISKGQKIAQIIFEELKSIPKVPYNKDDSASFNNELEYTGFGKYSSQYMKAKEHITNMTEKLESKVDGIYGNMLTLMGIFISIFAIVTVNFTMFSTENMKLVELLKSMVVVNISLAFVIAVLLGIVVIITDMRKWKKICGWLLGVLVAGVIVLCGLSYAVDKLGVNDMPQKETIQEILEEDNVEIK